VRQVMEATRQLSPERIIGRGGFGPVYAGKWRDKDVAVKVELSQRAACFRGCQADSSGVRILSDLKVGREHEL
jgi:hypothetical protein